MMTPDFQSFYDVALGAPPPMPPATRVRPGPRRARRKLEYTPEESYGLGVTAATGQKAAGVVASSAGVATGVISLAAGGASAATGAAAAALSVIPIVGIVAAVVGIVLQFVGKGCGNACIVAAQREQIYELTADMLNALAEHGYLPTQVAAAMMQSLITGAQQAEAQLNDKQGQQGAANAAKVIQSEAAGVVTYNVALVANPTMEGAQSIISSIGGSGWYPASVSAAQQLALQCYEQYLSSAPAPTSTAGGTGTTPGTSGALVVPGAGTAVLGPSIAGIPMGYVALGVGALLLYLIL